MNAKQTALDDYLARTAAIQAKLARACSNWPTTTSATTQTPSTGITFVTSDGWNRPSTTRSPSSMASANDRGRDGHRPKLTPTQTFRCALPPDATPDR